MGWRDKYKVSIPEGTKGDWSIKVTKVNKKQAELERFRALFSGSGRHVPEGEYTILRHKGAPIMSDTPDEIRDHLAPVYEAEVLGGHVLINGLGLGMVTSAVLKCDKVKKVTVIDNSPDVISLVAPTLKARYGSRLEIIEADAFKYKPVKGQRFSVVWHDIWPTLCVDNLTEMGTLHRKYGRRCDWQGSWGKELLKSLRRREQTLW